MMTTLATGTLLLGGISPAFAADVVVAGNGAGSQNYVSSNTNHTTDIRQTNTTSTSNFVLSNASTGGNSASGNTGGNTSVTSGAANTSVGIANEGGTNVLSMPNCGCESMNSSVLVAGNGAGSRTAVNLTDNQQVRESQTNNTYTRNTVIANAETGGNNASGNTGSSLWSPSTIEWMNHNGWNWNNGMWNYTGNTGGSSNVSSGPAYSTVGIYNGGNANVMH